MTDIREYLAHKPLLFDGGMGTYYKAAPGVECELANLTDPEGVKRVHAEYLAAGAQAIKTNTFGLPRMAAAQMPGWEELAEAGWKLACDAAAEKGAAVFADLGPAPDTEAAPASSASYHCPPIPVCWNRVKMVAVFRRLTLALHFITIRLMV